MILTPIYKITLLGDAAVGKTSLRNRFMGSLFNTSYMMTIGADFSSKMLNVDGSQMKFQIWDLAGQPRFSAVRELYYRSSLGALVVFDITGPESLQNIPNWADDLWEFNGRGIVPIILLGNKLDLREDFPDAVTSEQGKTLAEQLSERTREDGFDVPYLETSAKTGQNVDQAFALLGQKILSFIGKQSPSWLGRE